MPETVNVPVTDLLLDPQNARLAEEHPSQQAVALALAELQGSKLVSLAEDIVKSGLDPLTLIAVVPTADQKKRYIVLEGNRRILALKALDTPALVSPALSPADTKKLNRLAAEYADAPIEDIDCVLFASADDAEHWLVLRHTGINEGAGLVEWGAEEKDRFASRRGSRSPARQVLDFVAKHGSLSEEAEKSKKGIITSLARLLSTPDVRDRLGVELFEGVLYSRFPAEDAARGLSRIVEDLKTGDISVGDIYHADDRRSYIERFGASDLPRKTKALSEGPVSLDSLDTASRATPPKKRKRRARAKAARTALIPKDVLLDIDNPRINAIYNELLQLSVEQYPNSAAVTLRVFLELSIDHYISEKALMTDKERRDKPLAKRLKVVVTDLQTKGKIEKDLAAAIRKVADSQLLAASTVTFNQYVHNRFVFPQPSELRSAWDELQPFVKQVWE